MDGACPNDWGCYSCVTTVQLPINPAISTSLMSEPKLFHFKDYVNDLKKIGIQDTDLLLLHLAMTALKIEGHRYGSFLDAANTAAKFAVYATYLEQQKKLRRVGLIHHIEPKRVKVIVREVESILNRQQSAKVLGHREPEYLIGIPHLWKEKYPWSPGSPRIRLQSVSNKEATAIAGQLPVGSPPVQILGQIDFQDLLHEMHDLSQAHLPEDARNRLSDAMEDHVVFNLIYSGTVIRLPVPDADLELYGLARNSYSPQEKSSRVRALMRDAVRFVELLQLWVDRSPRVLRAIEVLELPVEKREAAFEELDKLVQDWADRHHQQGGEMVAMQMIVGDYAVSSSDGEL